MGNAAPKLTAPRPVPPRYDLWPVALRSAGRLRGVLVPCGPGVRGIDWPEGPLTRLNALAEFTNAKLIASHLTAAWVWGAARHPGTPLQLSTRPRQRRPLQQHALVHIRELRLHSGDIEEVHGFLVTSPLRTAIDLLYDAEFTAGHRAASRLLSHLVEGGWQAIGERIAAHRRPHRTVAQQRLRMILARDHQ